MKALLLCNYDVFNAAMVTEHINAIINHSWLDIYVHSTLVADGGDLDLAVDINEFDVIIIHYSIFLAVDAYCSTRTKVLLKAARGLKVAFLQDEYRFVDRSIQAMHEAGIDVVFSCVPEKSIPLVYPPDRMGKIQVVNTLTGYVSDYLSVLRPLPLKKRRYHVSYRGRRYPDWHGAMGREKYEIAELFEKRAGRAGLKTNISCKEEDRLYGARWVALIQNSRAVLGVESGASVFDFSGDISSRTETVRALMGRKGITYQQLRDKYFADREGLIDLAQISPRVLEAICLRTLCVLFEGSYSDILKPNQHYLPLKKDFSNFDEVARRLKDDMYVSEMIANAYSEVAMNPDLSYKHFVHGMDDTVIAAARKKFPHLVDPRTDFPLPAESETKPAAPARGTKASSKAGARTTREATLAERHMQYRRAKRFRVLFEKAHPFKQFRYPHAVASHSGGFIYKAMREVNARLPFNLRSAIKSLVR